MEEKFKILIVDDSEFNRSLLSDILSDEYEIVEAENGKIAIDYLDQHKDDRLLVLLDMLMPVMNGFDVLNYMNKNELINNIPVITISTESSAFYIEEAYRLGVIEYISRPFDEQTVKRRVKNALVVTRKQKQLEEMVSEQIIEKEQNNLAMIEILSNVVEFRNGESGLHIKHIRLITKILLDELLKITDKYKLTKYDVSLIVNASALHDIGKISIPDHILNKPGRLTPEEFEIIKTHPVIGDKILKSAAINIENDLIRYSCEICRWHHERYDGRGYPDGLIGDKIPISAQIVSLADVYDALISERVYKAAYSPEKAIEMILNNECGVFNPLLLECLQNGRKELIEQLNDHTTYHMVKQEVKNIIDSSVNDKSVSNRSLILLEQERTKFRFFEAMTNEIWFEYDWNLQLLTLSFEASKKLNIPENNLDVLNNQEILDVISKKDLLKIRDKIKKIDPKNPVYIDNFRLKIKKKKEWYRGAFRPIWDGKNDDSITKVIGKFIYVHAEYEAIKTLKKRAESDSLTKLMNRRSAFKKIEEILKNNKNNENTYAFCLFDIDSFKNINDKMGHLYGDEVLKCLAKNLIKNKKPNDIIARFGGDEFILFTEYDDKLTTKLKYLMDGFEDENIGRFTVSIGIALAPRDGKELREIFLHADEALYSIKDNKKNDYAFYDAESMGGGV